jgi:Putative transmembrane family 234
MDKMSSIETALGWNLLSMILVGAFWGCTNPLLRRGAVVAAEAATTTHFNGGTVQPTTGGGILGAFRQFLDVRVWLPYVVNQCGSIVFYVLLAKSDLTLAVPTCNALALVFSCLTSVALGEPMEKPIRTILGSALVVGGVAVCVLSSTDNNSKNDNGQSQQDREL